jgi:hypothetical protein
MGLDGCLALPSVWGEIDDETPTSFGELNVLFEHFRFLSQSSSFPHPSPAFPGLALCVHDLGMIGWSA